MIQGEGVWNCRDEGRQIAQALMAIAHFRVNGSRSSLVKKQTGKKQTGKKRTGKTVQARDSDSSSEAPTVVEDGTDGGVGR